MTRVKFVGAVVVLMAVMVGCGQEETPVPEASPSYSGPAWEAYKAGRDYAREHEDTGVPASVARTADPNGSLSDAVKADLANATWWCNNHLPSDLRAEHEEQGKDLLAGCIGGTTPGFDNPEAYAD